MEKKEAMDDKKSLKRQRIKTYFLEAAREIIINEGYENVSTRKVADVAGFSYATIYNYFKDLNHMIWEVKESMVAELFENLQKKMQWNTYDIDELKRGLRLYIEYYFENPNIFKFFYFYSYGRPDDNTEPSQKGFDYSSIWSEAFKGLVREGQMHSKDIEVAAKALIYAIHGMITLCFSKQGDLTEEKVYEELDRMVNYILQKK